MNIFIKNEKQEPPTYGTYIERRTPASKLHKRLGDAKNAINNQYPFAGGILYKLVDGTWEEIQVIKAADHCMYCGDNGDCKTSYWSQWHLLSWRGQKCTKTEKPIVCDHCYYEHFSYYSPNKIDPSTFDWSRG